MINWQEWVVGVLVVLCIARIIYGIFLFFRRTRENKNPCDSCVSGCELKDMLEKKRKECVHPVLFVASGMFCSFIYVNIIFAMALTFKHIGKALGVFLIILQIPGSSGTYPIEMMPGFFKKLNPFLPFTYSIRGMRECIAGFYENTYVKNIKI